MQRVHGEEYAHPSVATTARVPEEGGVPTVRTTVRKDTTDGDADSLAHAKTEIATP